jgi:DNA repair protein RecO (recombination protein O)
MSSVDKVARDHLQRCFVLHRREFGNTSLILEVFSGAYGRLPVLAKGARQARRGRSAGGEVLQPFRPLWLSWSGRGEVKTLMRSEPAGPAAGLTGKALYCGFYLNELLVRLLARGDPQEALFVFYHSALTALGAGEDLQSVLRSFELRLLREIGYGVELHREAATGRAVTPDGHYVYEQESGLRAAGAGDAPQAVSGEVLLQLATGGSLSGPAAREAKVLTRRLLAPYLGGRPLKSRELFKHRGPNP